MALMGFREYARHRGVTLRAVQKAIEAERIAIVEIDGARKIDADHADRDWRLNTDPAAQSLLYSAGLLGATGASNNCPEAEAGMAAGPGAAMSAAPGSSLDGGSARTDQRDETDDVPAPTDQTDEYRIERAKRERLRREREEIELSKIRGNIIELAEAKLVVFTSFRTLRDAMLHVAVRVKDRCAAETDPFVVEQIIEAEIVATFARFDPSRMLQPPDDDDDDADDDAILERAADDAG